MKSSSRSWLGYLCTFLGVLLMGTGLHFAGEPAVALDATQKAVVAGVSTVSGGLLSFGVGRRLLISREEDQSGEAAQKDQGKSG